MLRYAEQWLHSSLVILGMAFIFMTCPVRSMTLIFSHNLLLWVVRAYHQWKWRLVLNFIRWVVRVHHEWKWWLVLNSILWVVRAYHEWKWRLVLFIVMNYNQTSSRIILLMELVGWVILLTCPLSSHERVESEAWSYFTTCCQVEPVAMVSEFLLLVGVCACTQSFCRSRSYVKCIFQIF